MTKITFKEVVIKEMIKTANQKNDIPKELEQEVKQIVKEHKSEFDRLK